VSTPKASTTTPTYRVGDVLVARPEKLAKGDATCAKAKVIAVDPGAAGLQYEVLEERTKQPFQKVGSQVWREVDTINDFYTIQEEPMNTTINPGDVFRGVRSTASFDRIEVIGPRNTGAGGWICNKTDWYGHSHTSWAYGSTLLSKRYKRETKASDFNVDALAYQRPMRGGIPQKDMPLVPTRPIREVEAYRFLKTETATLIHVGSDGVRQAKGAEAKRQLLLNAEGGVMLLAVPGIYSMDTFYIDDRAVALSFLGLTPHTPVTTPQVVTDVSGREWVAA
jgi:hypothetical protein